ncbi:type II toxin-antitoxin system VapC family toxin [Deinococcus kurensis]|uniref:type II toxin-antitoxin system VapC family toxin n=1 Tax=Deinococcus kurensis TaxID=2662757 RepID=UPI0012D2A851|nr:type II toxin-antitoxin system VapC family toxin [Deinococcus kurensis]
MPKKVFNRQIIPDSKIIKPKNGVLIDTGVWMHAAGPQSNPEDRRPKIYSNLLSEIIEFETKIFITEIIYSEIFNFLITYFKGHYNKSISNKKYKSTDHYAYHLESIYAYLDSISQTPGLENISLADPSKCLQRLSSKLDFNDSVYVHLCMQGGLTMITDDRDFEDQPINIITANRSYGK